MTSVGGVCGHVKRLPNNLVPFPIYAVGAGCAVLFVSGTFLLNCYFRLLFSGMVARWQCCGKLSKR